MDKKQKSTEKLEGDFESPRIYRNFWSPKVLDSLNERIDAWEIHQHPVKVQYTLWPRQVVGDSGPILLIDCNDEEKLISDIKSELNVIYDTSILNWFQTTIQIQLRGSYIPWHNDAGYWLATTTYLNQEKWNANWGGALIYENKHHQFRAEFPEYNKIIVQSGLFNEKHDMHHSTSILSQAARPRFCLQTFAAPTQPQDRAKLDDQVNPYTRE